MKKGFSVIELLVVIAIFAILTAILTPVFGGCAPAGSESGSDKDLLMIGMSKQGYREVYHWRERGTDNCYYSNSESTLYVTAEDCE